MSENFIRCQCCGRPVRRNPSQASRLQDGKPSLALLEYCLAPSGVGYDGEVVCIDCYRDLADIRSAPGPREQKEAHSG